MKQYIKLMRPHHYIKNLLIILPIFFSNKLFDLNSLGNIIISFITFCLLCSAIYIINDIQDIEKDKLHPIKKDRPLASGKASKKVAGILVIILLVVSFAINILLLRNIWVILCMLAYFIINVLYSMKLKNIPVLDIVILSFGFFLRVLYGAVVIDVEISNWLYLTILSGAFYLGLGKRRNELMKNGESSRNVLKYYNKEFLDKNMYLCLTLAIVFYSLWCIDKNVATMYNSNLILTIPLILIICMKYNLDIEGDSFGDPVEVLIRDKTLIILIVIYAIMLFGILYGTAFWGGV